MKNAAAVLVCLLGATGLWSGSSTRAFADDSPPSTPLPNIVAILNAAIGQKIQFSSNDFAKAAAANSPLGAQDVKDANSNNYADNGGGVKGAPAASLVGWMAENVFGLRDPRVELAYQRACALPYNESYYVNFCAALGKFYEKRGDYLMALAVFTLAPKCVHETNVSARLGPPCLQHAALMYSQTGDENNATRVYGQLCSEYADCEEYNRRGGHADLAAAQEQFDANVQAQDDQRRQEKEDRAEQAQASNARFNAVLGALQGMTGGSNPNAILDTGAQQAAAIRAVGDAQAERQAAASTARQQQQVNRTTVSYQSAPPSTASTSTSPATFVTVSAAANGQGTTGTIAYSTPLAASCVRQFSDPNSYNWLSLENDCGQAIYVTIIFNQNVGWAMTQAMNLTPGSYRNTGLSSNDINRAGGFETYVCPRSSVPVDLSGNVLLNTNVTEYRCKQL